tara:strand:- start:209 stop:700 length:492 start_codon:yes stop_codon:yes gene_type:complete
MHNKKKYTNKTKYSIQGLRPVSKTLPSELKTILRKGGHNYSTIINNWPELVGKKISSVCYPKSIKTGRELKNGTLFLNIKHGEQLLIEYNKKDIIEKINAFFGYQYIKEIRLYLIKEKIETKKVHSLNKVRRSKYHKKIENLNNIELKKKLKNLIDVFSGKKN